MITSPGEAEALARTGRTSFARFRRWRPFHVVLFVWGLPLAIFAQQVVGPKLVLTMHYGWERVWGGEGLTVVEKRSIGKPPASPPGVSRGRYKQQRDSRWTLSNGDKIRVWRVERYLCWLAAWAVMMAATVPFVWLAWRWLTKWATAKGVVD